MDPWIIFTGILLAALVLLLFMPLRGTRSFLYEPPSKRIHEEDAVLSRRLLSPGTPEYRDYYEKHPEKKENDDRSRESPGLLSHRSLYYHPGTFAAARANFDLIDHLAERITGPPSSPRSIREDPPDPERAGAFIRTWMKKSGAHSVGFTPLKDYHLYSHKGRGERKGQPIHRNHSHAVALTVEMNHDMLQAAPRGSTVMESSEQYLRSGILAVKLAGWIRELGYAATAHIDGNYEVICPLVAVDAGLGVMGRMGLLMTPRLGPRVRIAVVTTSLPLPASPVNPDPATIHSCHMCSKCAVNCPAGAIPDGPRESIDGALRWRIHSEKCYHFWTLSGTDCGRCMAVCPYSHRDTLPHRLVRTSIKNNLVFRWLAIKLDDVFYGRKPPPRPLPTWSELTDQS